MAADRRPTSRNCPARPRRAPIAAGLVLLLAACEEPSSTPALGVAAPAAAPAATPAPATTPAPESVAPATPTAAPAVIEPAEYLRLHNLATTPRDPAWAQALGELVAVGDAYTLLRLRSLDRAALTETQAATLDATIAAIAAGPAARSDPPTAAEIQARLERAAWADLRCDRCEQTLVPWATQSLADVADDPDVRATLERLRDSYEPAPGFEPDSPWGHLSDRVRSYAGQILQGKGAQEARKTP